MDQRHRLSGVRALESCEGIFLKENGGGEGRKEIEAHPGGLYSTHEKRGKGPLTAPSAGEGSLRKGEGRSAVGQEGDPPQG